MRSENNDLKDIDDFVGQRLRMRRLQLGLTLMKVAAKLSISHQQMQKYELGQTRLSAPILYQISNIYGVKPQYFFEGFAEYMQRKNGSSAQSQEARHECLNIMALGDNPAEELKLRQIIQESSKRSIDLFFVHSSMQALNVLRHKGWGGDFPRPDIILLDLDTSKKDGLSLLREIKRDRDIMDIPVIIFASAVNQSLLSSIYSYQAAGYICKNSDNYQQRVKQLIDYWSSSVLLPFLLHDEASLPQDTKIFNTL